MNTENIMIPFCKKRTIGNGFLVLPNIKIGGEKDACDFARAYLSYFIQEEVTVSQNANIILVNNANLKNGAYGLCMEKRCVIHYGDNEGIRNALATLIVIMQYKDGVYILPCQDIEDYPDCLHRGVMID